MASNPIQYGRVSLLSSVIKGGPAVWLSLFLMGAGNIAGGQIVKGLIFLIIQVAAFVFFPSLSLRDWVKKHRRKSGTKSWEYMNTLKATAHR